MKKPKHKTGKKLSAQNTAMLIAIKELSGDQLATVVLFFKRYSRIYEKLLNDEPDKYE